MTAFKTWFCWLALVLAIQLASSFALTAAERPNFVWILSEDNSSHYLKSWNKNGAPTPQIDKLAAQGITFNNAFSCSPVCSVARTTLITSCYAPRIGTQFHRRSVTVPLPDGLQMFPAYLRQAGYYTTNNSKTDYNAIAGPGVWDESSKAASWEKRPAAETPFFHMQTYTMSHESSLHFSAQQMQREATETSPDAVAVAPYHPDTPLMRYTYARYHDRIGLIDTAVGKLVDQLRDEDLLEDTFVFYFGDHGGVLPRSKGYVYESGLHIPLVVRIPKNWQHLVTLLPGSRTDGFVSFVDFGPTLLHLAGLEIPEQVDGRPFLGSNITADELNSRDEALGYADRFDEKYDLCRSLRKGRFKYIRNYQPFYPDALQNNYRYKMLAYEQWRQLYRAGELNAVQRQFFEAKPAEALFDLETDPYEVKNLAADPAYANTLLKLRGNLQARLKSLPDLSFYPESHLVEHAFDNPVAFGQKHKEEIATLIDTADLSLLPFDESAPLLKKAMASRNAWQRYWALIAGSSFGKQAEPLTQEVRERLTDSEPLVRVRAAEFLALTASADPRPTLYQVLNSTDSPIKALLTFNTAIFLNDRTEAPYPFDLNGLQMKIQGDGVNRRVEYLKSLGTPSNE